MSNVNADWHIGLYITCPYCEEYFDVLGTQYLEGLPQIGQSRQDLEIDIQCPKCKSDLIVESTQY